MIIFLSCVKSKRNTQSKAQDLYTSDLFKKSLLYARQLNADKIYILSAKYGVLELEDIVAPYELTLNAMTEKQRKMWAYKVIKQCEQKRRRLYRKSNIFMRQKLQKICNDKIYKRRSTFKKFRYRQTTQIL